MSVDETVYAAPGSALERPPEGSARSLEDAIAGNWDFDIMDVLSESWQKLSGAKGAMWVGFLISYAITFVLQLVVGGMLGIDNDPNAGAGAIAGVMVLSLGGQAITFIVTGGIYYYAIKWSAGDHSATATDVLAGFSVALPLLGMWFLMILLIWVGFLLLILPGLYLTLAYSLAAPLIVERGLGIWEALETSRKAITNHWFKVFGLGLVATLAALLGTVVTLGIGLIWAAPFFFMVYGVLYNRIFGYSGSGATAG